MQVVSTGQAARRLQISTDTVLLLIRNGQIKAERISDKSHWRIRQDELQRFAEERGITLLPENLTEGK